MPRQSSDHPTWLRAVVLAWGCLLAWCGGAWAQDATLAVADARGTRPNIIFLMADDLGYGDLGCYGQQEIQTPHVDRLASEGLKFSDVYAGSTICAPARSVLMTGRHTGRTTVRGNFGQGGVRGLGGGSGRVPLRAEDLTVAEVLKQAGYVTAMTGKWGLGEPGTTGEPHRQGFDHFFGFLNQRRAHSYYPEFIWHNTEKHPLPGNTGGRREQYVHDLFTDFALDFLREHGPASADGERPFFLYLPYTVPHSRYEIPSVEPYTDKPWKQDEKVHAAMVTRLDRDLGRIMALLQELKIDERTLVFFCSDNGAAQRWTSRFDSSGPLRGRKRDLYEGGLRTPMVVRWPGRVPADRDSAAPWYFADVLPTLAELAGAEIPEDIDGVSVLPALLTGQQDELAQRPMYWEYFEGGFQQAARLGNFKAVRPRRGGPIELYDLAQDIGETSDIAEAHPEQVAWFARYFEEARIESPHWPLPE